MVGCNLKGRPPGPACFYSWGSNSKQPPKTHGFSDGYSYRVSFPRLHRFGIGIVMLSLNWASLWKPSIMRPAPEYGFFASLESSGDRSLAGYPTGVCHIQMGPIWIFRVKFGLPAGGIFVEGCRTIEDTHLNCTCLWKLLLDEVVSKRGCLCCFTQQIHKLFRWSWW